MRFVRRFTTLIFLWCSGIASLTYGQVARKLPDVKIDGLCTGSLGKTLNFFGQKYGVKFSFNQKEFDSYEYFNRFMETPLQDALEQICKELKLKYFYADDGTIYLMNRSARMDPKLIGKAPIEQRSYRGAAKTHNFTLTGRVLDKAAGESLPFVTIQVKGTNIGVSTNVDGYYSLLKVPTDTSTLVVSYLGYAPKTIFLNPELPKNNLVIELEPAVQELDVVVVKGEREELMRANNPQVSMLKMTPKMIATLPNVGEKDIFRAFQLMPGVSASNEASAGLYVRGGTPDKNLVLYDGFTVYHVDHLFGFFSAFNSNALKDVQLYKGGFESKFGGRTSSVVEITGKEGNQRQFNAGVDASFLSVNAFTEMPVGDKFSMLFAARRSWKGPLYNKIFNLFNKQSTNTALPGGARPGGGRGGFNGPSFNTQVASYFYDLNGKLTFKPTEKDIISLSLYNGTDDLDNSRKLNFGGFGGNTSRNFNSNTNDITEWGNTGTSLKWSRRWNDTFYSNVLASYSNYFSNRDRSNDGTITNPDGTERSFRNGTIEDNDLKDFTFKFDNEWKVTDNQQIEFGLQATTNNIKYSFKQNDTTTVISRADKGSTYSAYLQDKIKIGKLNLTPGLRLSYYGITSKVYTEPRLSATYDVNKQLRLKAALGQYYQFANRVVREDLLNGSRDFWILADDKAVPINGSTHYIIGVSYETKDYLFSTEFFHKDITGLTEYSQRILPRRLVLTFEENFYSGTGQTTGLELLAQKKYGKYNGWVSYTYSKTRYNFDAFGGKFAAAQDVPHEFKIVNLYKWRNWDFSATWIYATGRPYTAPEGSYQIDLLGGTPADFINVGRKNGRRLPNYHRFDVAATYNFRWGNMPASLGLSVFNLYNRSNTWYKEYQIEEGQLIETNVNFLGTTPNLTLSIKLH